MTPKIDVYVYMHHAWVNCTNAERTSTDVSFLSNWMMSKWMWKTNSSPNCSWAELNVSASVQLNIESMKAIDFFIAWGYIDFSLWLCFPQTQEEEKQLQTDAQIADVSTKKGAKNRYLAEDGAVKDTQWNAAELQEGHKPVERLFLPPARLLGGGHLFLAHGGFDLFASASVSSIYKGHEREWVIHLSVCICVYLCVRLDLFLLHWHDVGISASQVWLKAEAL